MGRRRAVVATAYHEAGHAVAYYVVRTVWGYRVPPVRGATIVPEGDTLGHVAPFPRPSFRPDVANSSPRTVLRVHGMIVISLAGGTRRKSLPWTVDDTGGGHRPR
jgi:hypothetical protein